MSPSHERSLFSFYARGGYTSLRIPWGPVFFWERGIFLEGAISSMLSVFISLKRRFNLSFQALQERVLWWIKPPAASLVLGTLADLTRGRTQLLAENAFFRRHLIILSGQVKRPPYRKADRFLLVLLARIVRIWKQALFLVQPQTLLRWYRELIHWFWKRKLSRPMQSRAD